MTKFLFSTLAAVFVSQFAWATPGDVLCSGTLGGKLELDVLIAYNYHEQGAVGIKVTAKNEVIFSSDEVQALVMSNETLLSADSGKSKVDLVIKNPNADTGKAEAIMDIAISGGLKAYSVELTCEM